MNKVFYPELSDQEDEVYTEREREIEKEENFMIIARVEALIAGLGMEEAIRRAKAYEKAGADAIIIHSKKNSPNEVFEFADKWKGSIPLVVVPTSYPSVKTNELISHKIKMVIYANQSLRAAHNIILKVLIIYIIIFSIINLILHTFMNIR